jgi:hypothetical protein
VTCGATLLAEIGHDRARYPAAGHLAVDVGVSPVAVQPERQNVAGFRRGCDHSLPDGISTLADATRKRRRWVQGHYISARAR